MKNHGTFTKNGALQFERLLPGPVDRVWNYLTQPNLRGKWLASGSMDLREGGGVELIFNHKTLTPHDDPIPAKYKDIGEVSSMHGTITQLDAPKLLSYTCAEESGESEVTFDLMPKDDNVLLILTHHKLGGDRNMILGIAAGWHTHLGILEDKLKGREPKPFWKVHMNFEKEYAKIVDQKNR